ncbi:MAG TPA: PPC domain-containing DNA-binding protein [Thermoanaerobaculia bacterium]|nr:PPC domain-containing DNA-binding protein [Thermoanaerobaculia bacterium]
MKHRLLEEGAGGRSFVLVFEYGEQVVGPLNRFANEVQLRGSSVAGIGAFERAHLGYFNPETKEFHENAVDEQVEVLSLTGNIAEDARGERKLHLHVVLGCRDASTRGGHLIDAVVRPTLELMITELPRHLKRKHDPKSGLVLLEP